MREWSGTLSRAGDRVSVTAAMGSGTVSLIEEDLKAKSTPPPTHTHSCMVSGGQMETPGREKTHFKNGSKIKSYGKFF